MRKPELSSTSLVQLGRYDVKGVLFFIKMSSVQCSKLMLGIATYLYVQQNAQTIL